MLCINTICNLCSVSFSVIRGNPGPVYRNYPNDTVNKLRTELNYMIEYKSKHS